MSITRSLFVLMVCSLLAPGAVAENEFPDAWYYDRPKEHTDLEGNAAPPITVGEWVGGQITPQEMKGSILVIDFWATWCGPCIAAMPKNSQIAKKYADQGVKLIGVCTSGDAATMPKLVKDNKAEYPNAYAKGDQVTRDWPIQWYPTYAVVDREGIVRAMGLKPDGVVNVIESLLAEEAAAQGRVIVKPSWLEGDATSRSRLAKLEEQKANPPALQLENWHNSEALSLDQLKGKVVVLDFWATFSPSCLKAIKLHNELIDNYGPDGLVFIGVTATLGSEALKPVIDKHGIRYPVAVDIDNQTNIAYSTNGFPDYYLIDKAGNLRIADCSNAMLEDAIVALLSEQIVEEKEGEADQDAGEADDKTNQNDQPLPDDAF